MGKPYRKNVGGLLRNADGLYLLCERVDLDGVWQLPQGGVDAGESLEDALWRELEEELGLPDPRSLCTLAGIGPEVRYHFPSDFQAPIAKAYAGQDQTIFLLDYYGGPSEIRVTEVDEPEFQSTRWVSLRDALRLTWHLKRPVLEATIQSLSLSD